MHIRRFAIGDELSLFQVYFSAIHEIAIRDYTMEQINAWAPADLDPELWRNHMRKLRPFVAELDGEIVGYADVQANGYVDHFFVSGHHARQGVGTLLMGRIHQEAETLCLQQLTSDVSRTAQPFFARFGFQIMEQRSPVRRGLVIPNALMRKTLPISIEKPA
jgi:putative acetyltransferase